MLIWVWISERTWPAAYEWKYNFSCSIFPLSHWYVLGCCTNYLTTEERWLCIVSISNFVELWLPFLSLPQKTKTLADPNLTGYGSVLTAHFNSPFTATFTRTCHGECLMVYYHKQHTTGTRMEVIIRRLLGTMIATFLLHSDCICWATSFILAHGSGKNVDHFLHGRVFHSTSGAAPPTSAPPFLHSSAPFSFCRTEIALEISSLRNE